MISPASFLTMMIGRGCPGPLSSRMSSIIVRAVPMATSSLGNYRPARIVDYPIWVHQYEVIARHPLNICTMPRKEKSPDSDANSAEAQFVLSLRAHRRRAPNMVSLACLPWQSKRGLRCRWRNLSGFQFCPRQHGIAFKAQPVRGRFSSARTAHGRPRLERWRDASSRHKRRWLLHVGGGGLRVDRH